MAWIIDEIVNPLLDFLHHLPKTLLRQNLLGQKLSIVKHIVNGKRYTMVLRFLAGFDFDVSEFVPLLIGHYSQLGIVIFGERAYI